MSFIVGHYTATFTPPGGSSADIGDTREGYRLREGHLNEPIITDTFGDAPQDIINRGSEAEITLDYVDYDKIKACLYTMNPRGETKTNVGKLGTALAGTLVLTPVAGTPAATLEGAFTATKAIVLSDIETLYATKLRQGPCTFKLLPDPSTGKLYTVAAAA